MDEVIKDYGNENSVAPLPETSDTNEPKRKTDRQDKMTILKAKKEKADKALEKASSKAAAIEAEIAAEEKKLHDKEIKRLDNLCSKSNITFSDIIGLVEIIIENKFTVNDVVDLIGSK